MHCFTSLTINNTNSGFGHSKPAGQSLQLSFPPWPNVVVPSGQRTALCFGEGHMCPIGHSVQLATPRKEKVPAGQGLVEELGVGQLSPAGQCLQDEAPYDRYLKYYIINSIIQL